MRHLVETLFLALIHDHPVCQCKQHDQHRIGMSRKRDQVVAARSSLK